MVLQKSNTAPILSLQMAGEYWKCGCMSKYFLELSDEAPHSWRDWYISNRWTL